MQRWIAIGVVTISVMMGGAFFAFKTYKANRPHPIWVPLPINKELTLKKREEIAKDLKEKLIEPEVLRAVCNDLQLTKKWGLSSEDETVKQLSKRLFVKVGEADTNEGRVPSINIGVSGKKKDVEVSSEVAMRLIKEVQEIIGIPMKPKDDFIGE